MKRLIAADLEPPGNQFGKEAQTQPEIERAHETYLFLNISHSQSKRKGDFCDLSRNENQVQGGGVNLHSIGPKLYSAWGIRLDSPSFLKMHASWEGNHVRFATNND